MSFYYSTTTPCPLCEKPPTLRRLNNGVAYICSRCQLSSGETVSEEIAKWDWAKAIKLYFRYSVENHY